jgi:mono/diheme cytochrome c family protein
MVRAGQDAGIQSLFARVADDKLVMWQRSALLHGAEVALLNAALPGTATRAAAAVAPAAAAPCPTCPGARGGPGGASAFPSAPAGGATRGGGAGGARGGGAAPAAASAAPAAGRGRGAGGPVLRLQREPALSSVATGGGELAVRATAVLARVEWPGKPGASAPVAPLTADEQKRFDAGKAVFESLCAACHQADGRGRDHVAPSLVGSELALAPGAVTARILLNGKEGSVGLMPPLGASLSDDQIAGVLTYVRREWGQTGSPVDPDTVRQVRALTATRTRAWTNEELLALANAAGN